MAFIYQFINNLNEIIYIGITKDLNSRMYQHFNNYGHLDSNVYKEVDHVLYSKVNSVNEAKIYEIYYISKLKPKHNTLILEDGETSLQLPELEFKLFDENNNYTLNSDEIKDDIDKNLKQITFFINWIETNCRVEIDDLNNYTNLSKDDKELLIMRNKVITDNKESILNCIDKIKDNVSKLNVM